MELKQGYSYHVKDEFFELVHDRYLMSNKEDGSYRPHFYAIQDQDNPQIYWMIPISSQVSKYKGIIEKKKQKHGRCNTIVIGMFGGNENAFLIQNTFPIIEKYLDHIHTIGGKPVTVYKGLDRVLVEYLREVIAMDRRGIKLTFTDINEIKAIMENELK
jgi:hypothetical protein